MKILAIIFGIFTFLFISKTTITLNPFKITMQSPWLAIGWFIIACGVVLVLAETFDNGYKKGSTDTIELVKKQIYEIKSSEGIQPKE